MKQPEPTKEIKFFHIHYKEGDDQIALSDQSTLRLSIGILGMILPLALFVFLFIDTGYAHPLPSISHYYMTRVCSLFIIIISMLAIFLIIYKGRSPVDFYISTIAGVFALLLLLFPTSPLSCCCLDKNMNYSITFVKDCRFREVFHYVSAAIFLSCLAFMALFLFTKSNKTIPERGRPKRIRNRIYRVCGILMILSILCILLGAIDKAPWSKFYNDNQLTFWFETSAVESFGFAWLIKGNSFFKD